MALSHLMTSAMNVDVALEDVKTNLKELLKEVSPDDRMEGFKELMTMKPFSEYDLTLEDLGDF